jgi:hypothetical protein
MFDNNGDLNGFGVFILIIVFILGICLIPVIAPILSWIGAVVTVIWILYNILK